MQKKIGILTFHNALNYGAVLQAFALQTYLKVSTGDDVEIIDYDPNGHNNLFLSQKVQFGNPIKKIIGHLVLLYYSASFKERKRRFESFVSDFHHLSERQFSCIRDFEEKPLKYDVLIVGSDQVFNPKKDSQIYYLGFKNNTGLKIAYAPSIGISKLTESQEQRIKPWVKDFDALSCREVEGAEILSGIYGKNVPVVCDPTFLLSKNQWDAIAIAPPAKNYIFVFDLNGGPELFELAKRLKKQTGLPIVYSSLKGIHPYVRACKTRHDLGPSEWLGHIFNASYVVTDSFHGTAISLIGGKKVLTIIGAKSTSSRITSLMKMLKITDQIIYDYINFDLSKIRFADFKPNLQEFIDRSKAFLTEALKIENERTLDNK